MKSLFVFYVEIILPFSAIVLGARYNYISPDAFALLMLLFCCVYHPFICGIRLIEGKKLSWSKFWYTFIPFWNWKYNGFLFFNMGQ